MQNEVFQYIKDINLTLLHKHAWNIWALYYPSTSPSVVLTSIICYWTPPFHVFNSFIHGHVVVYARKLVLILKFVTSLRRITDGSTLFSLHCKEPTNTTATYIITTHPSLRRFYASILWYIWDHLYCAPATHDVRYDRLSWRRIEQGSGNWC